MAEVRPKRPENRDQARRDREAMGVVVSTYEPTEIRFGKFRTPVSGLYRLRFSAFSFWIDPKFTEVTVGRRPEPVTIYSDSEPRILRKLGSFDVGVTPTVRQLEVFLLASETIRPDAARLFRSRPPDHKNPLTMADGMPGVAFQWMEVEGPLIDEWPPAGHKLLFGDLPMVDRPVTTGTGRAKVTAGVEVTSQNPGLDAEILLRKFMEQAYRAPVDNAEVGRFLSVMQGALKVSHSFTDSMIAGSTAVLSSLRFLYFNQQRPGVLEDRALAERLSYFLWNSSPDAELRQLAKKRKLHRPDVLRAQTERLLNDPKAFRFVEAFLDYWLDLPTIATVAPDTELYPDYQLDDLLVESMTAETRLFFFRTAQAKSWRDQFGELGFCDAQRTPCDALGHSWSGGCGSPLGAAPGRQRAQGSAHAIERARGHRQRDHDITRQARCMDYGTSPRPPAAATAPQRAGGGARYPGRDDHP